jgi:hypothetical protein
VQVISVERNGLRVRPISSAKIERGVIASKNCFIGEESAPQHVTLIEGRPFLTLFGTYFADLWNGFPIQ